MATASSLARAFDKTPRHCMQALQERVRAARLSGDDCVYGATPPGPRQAPVRVTVSGMAPAALGADGQHGPCQWANACHAACKPLSDSKADTDELVAALNVSEGMVRRALQNVQAATYAAAERQHAPTCVICLHELQSSGNVVSAPCGHTFHRPCLKYAKNGKSECPMCRRSFRARNLRIVHLA